MGSLFRVKVYESDLKELFSMNSEKYKLPVLGAILNGKNIYSELLPAKGLLVIGNESRGVNTDYHKYFTHSISIPSFNRNQQAAESLNAAVATGIICSEWNRHQSL